MKNLFSILVLLALATTADAGIVGWITSEARDWAFVQETGGIRIRTPIEKDGRKILPVDYSPEYNSGLAVRKINLKKKGHQIVIVVFTQLVEKESDTSRTHYVDLSKIVLGRYEVYYDTAGDPAKLLGQIDIK